MENREYRTVIVRRDGKIYKRKQPMHHRINKGIMKREIKRLEEQKEVIEQNISNARKRVKRAIL